jgi:hypothetical protein
MPDSLLRFFVVLLARFRADDPSRLAAWDPALEEFHSVVLHDCHQNWHDRNDMPSSRLGVLIGERFSVFIDDLNRVVVSRRDRTTLLISGAAAADLAGTLRDAIFRGMADDVAMVDDICGALDHPWQSIEAQVSADLALLTSN